MANKEFLDEPDAQRRAARECYRIGSSKLIKWREGESQHYSPLVKSTGELTLEVFHDGKAVQITTDQILSISEVDSKLIFGSRAL